MYSIRIDRLERKLELRKKYKYIDFIALDDLLCKLLSIELD